MPETPGPSPKEMGITPEIKEKTISDLVEVISTYPYNSRVEVQQRGEWPQLIRDMEAVKNKTQEFEMPEVIDKEESLQQGRQFLQYLADNPNLFSTLMNTNEDYRSLIAIYDDLPNEHGLPLASLTISAQDLRSGGNRGEVDYPHHLSISPSDLQQLENEAHELQLFVTFPDAATGVFSAKLITLNKEDLGIWSEEVDHEREKAPPAKILVIPYDVFVNPIYKNQEGIVSQTKPENL